jgi:hypothetical protein
MFIFPERFEIDLKEQETFHIIDVCDPEVTEANNNERNTIFMKGSNPLSIEISNHQGLIITNPDISVSPTKIAESCSCLRRGVLNDKIRNFGISAPSAIMGNVRHFFIEVKPLVLTTTLSFSHIFIGIVSKGIRRAGKILNIWFSDRS